MSIERTEEETIESLKRWWQENGRSVIAGIVLGLGGLFGVRYWFDYQAESRQQASALYGDLQLAIQAQELDQAHSVNDSLRDQYAATPYATLAALALAGQQVEAGELTAAAEQLQWALDNTREAEYRHIARLRLARVRLAQDAPDQAEALLAGVNMGAYASLYEELRGDILAARGLRLEAAEKYRLAMAAARNPVRYQFLEMKLADLAQAGDLPLPGEES